MMRGDLRFNVAQLLKGPTGGVRKYDLDFEVEGLDEEIQPIEPLLGSVKLVRTGRGILLTGRLHTRLMVDCHRCLEPFPVPIGLDLEEEFLPTVNIGEGNQLPEIGDDEALLIDEHHILDMTEVVRQNILLAMPSHPLCHADCKGLCPECGQNLNEGTCDCLEAEIDPRWQALLEVQSLKIEAQK